MPKNVPARRIQPARQSSQRTRAPLMCLGLLVTLAACEILGPGADLPANAQRVDAPAEYREWWQKTESCSGRAGSFDRIQWYVIPEAESFATPAGPKVGLWSHSGDGVRIIVAGNYAETELVVRHEMLHALLDREGHPEQYFQEKCQLTWDTWGRDS